MWGPPGVILVIWSGGDDIVRLGCKNLVLRRFVVCLKMDFVVT